MTLLECRFDACKGSQHTVCFSAPCTVYRSCAMVGDIGTQQLGFPGNCQCRLSFLNNMHKETRAQVLIFDTAQRGYYYYLSNNEGTWTHCYDTLFRGSLNHKRGILGHHMAWTTITSWGIFISTVSHPTQICAVARLVSCNLSNNGISLTENAM